MRNLSDFVAAAQGIDPKAHKVNKLLDRKFLTIINENGHWPELEIYRPFPYWQPARGGIGQRIANWLEEKDIHPQTATLIGYLGNKNYNLASIKITGDTHKGKIFGLERGLEATVIAAHEFAHYWLFANYSSAAFLRQWDTPQAALLQETISDSFAVAVVHQYYGESEAENVRQTLIRKRHQKATTSNDVKHDTSFALSHYDFEPGQNGGLEDAMLYAINLAIDLQNHPETVRRWVRIAAIGQKPS